MSSILKHISLIVLLSIAVTGCARRHTTRFTEDSRQMSEAMEIAAERAPIPPEPPPENPGDLVITSAPPTTGRYVDTQPSGYPNTRIILRVADRGITRRAWTLAVTPRPSGDVLAGPTYWPTIDKAVRRPNTTNAWLEPLEFLYNIALLPYRVVETPPWSKVIYSPSGGIDWSNVEQSGIIFQERNE